VPPQVVEEGPLTKLGWVLLNVKTYGSGLLVDPMLPLPDASRAPYMAPALAVVNAGVLALLLVGFISLMKQRRATELYVLFYAMAVLAFYAQARFIIPVLPFLYV